MSDLKIFKTGDGSSSIYNPTLDETYHSRHGALQESQHVFINQGLAGITNKEVIRVLEVGLGTGLNCLLTQEYAEKNQQTIDYTGIELFPLSAEIIAGLNYNTIFKENQIEALHQSAWEEKQQLSPFFQLTKHHSSIHDYQSDKHFDIIYFDAFAPNKQPDMWEPKLFSQLYSLLNPKGILVTYCAKGQFKRDLKEVGFTVHSLAGPPRKHEMVKAEK